MYSEGTTMYKNSIGYADTFLGDSIEGFVFAFAIYNQDISSSQSSYVGGSYSPGNCTVDACPSNCNPSYPQWTWYGGSTYYACISISTNISQSGNSTACSSFSCPTGVSCSADGCLTCSCSYNNTQSCRHNSYSYWGGSSGVVCNCPGNMNANSTSCSCQTGQYFSGSHCSDCNEQCSQCIDAVHCTSCISYYASPAASIGCICNAGFYNVSSLDKTSSCYACSSTCATCSSSSTCLTCITSNAYVATNGACVCKLGFYSTGSLTSINSCIACYSNCATCNTAVLICLTCITAHASVYPTVGCVCNSGYYNTTALTTSNACISCYSDCSTCNQAFVCLTCKSLNSSPSPTQGCVCNTRYYNTTALTTSSACLVCYYDCITCNKALVCLTCISSYSTPTANKGCSCNTGYYNKTLLTTSTSCIICYSDCITCNQANLCLACKDTNASPLGTIGCQCKAGYYNTSSLSTNGACIACFIECATCNQTKICLTCQANNASPTATQGCSCNSQYYNTSSLTSSSSCIHCYSDCATCTQAFLCSTCIAINSSPSAPKGCKCNPKFYNTTSLATANSCIACNSDCATCSAANLCIICTATNATIKNTAGCRCKDGYYGVSPLNSLTSCDTPCNSECQTCSNGTSCETCISSNALPNTTGNGCYCSGVGMTTTHPISSINSCSNCNQECSSCSSSTTLLCLTCRSLNANPSSTQGCDCQTGYWGTHPLTLSSSCSPCNSDCYNCTNANQCITCISQYANPSVTIGCNCIDGYWGVSPLSLSNSCQKCYNECALCTQSSTCDTCISLNASPDITIGCKCNDGYYNITLLTTANSCTPCISPCLTCVSSPSYKCLSCITTSAITLISGNCVCNGNNYWDTSSLSCKACNSLCNGCESYNYCLNCSSSLYELNNNGQCNYICPEGYYSNQAKCIPCDNLCINCTIGGCIDCVTNANFVNNICQCMQGYNGTKECDRMTFSAQLSISSKNIVTLTFTDQLNFALSSGNFSLSITNNAVFTYNFYCQDNETYIFSIYSTVPITNGSIITITIKNSNLTSQSNSLYNGETLKGSLSSYTPSIKLSAATAAIMNNSQTITKSVVSISIVAGLLSNPACIWTLFNMIEIITYLPLNSMPYPDQLSAFFTNAGPLGIIPNPITYLVPSDTDAIPYLEAERYGFTTSLFIINAGPFIYNFIIFILLIPLFYIVSKTKFGAIAVKCAKLLSNYKYNFFLRYWMQTYLDLALLALIQMRSVKNI